MNSRKSPKAVTPKEKIQSPPALRLFRVVVGLPGEVQSSNFELSAAGVGATEETAPVQVQEVFSVPKNFEVGFFYESLSRSRTRLWRVIFQIQVSKDGTPRTKEILISGDNYVRGPDGIEEHPEPTERVNSNNLILVGRSVRNLEVTAFTLAIQTFENTPNLHYEMGQWNRMFMTLSEKMIQKIEKDTFDRVTYKKRSPEFLQRIADLYREAEKMGVPPIKSIQDEISGEELRNVARGTAESWVRTARNKGYLVKKEKFVAKNSSPTKAVKDARKPKTTKKIGEK